MFCHDTSGILDSTFPGFVRDDLGISGWHNVRNLDQLHTLLTWTYWYRKYGPKYKLLNKIRAQCENRPFWQVKAAIVQSLHTLNALLMKKFFSFGPEISDYRCLADQTAQLFANLFVDYTHSNVYNHLGTPIEPEGLVYSELKSHLNFIKETFHREERTERFAWLKPQLIKNKALRNFFRTEYSRLTKYISTRQQSMQQDYTLSPAFIFRATNMCQTRVIGYLPPAVAEARRWQFRENISRPYEPLAEDQKKFIRAAIFSRFKRAFPPGEMGVNPFYYEAELREMAFENLTEAVGNINLMLKGTASTQFSVSSGGKIEEARQLIGLAKKNKWSVPIRDLNTGDPTIEKLDFYPEMDPTELARPLFWLSYQICLNWAIRNSLWKRKKDFVKLLDGDDEYCFDPMDASIVHISEPGKERNLTKCTGVYAWFLTPASKITQKVLARLEEHRAGLESSSHEWTHQKRISVESEEAGFMYNTSTWKTHEWVRNSFKDWTESTDFISKRVGWAIMSAIFDYIKFPRGYRNLIMLVITLPQPVTEVIQFSAVSEDEAGYTYERQRIKWSGLIREGFMMGNPLTKTILHSTHIPELEFSRRFLSEQGLNVSNTWAGNPRLRQRPRIDLDAINESEEFELSQKDTGGSSSRTLNAFSSIKRRPMNF
jgi:hypothetical protein